MAKNLKPCSFIVRTGGEALSSVEATAKALEDKQYLDKMPNVSWHGSKNKNLVFDKPKEGKSTKSNMQLDFGTHFTNEEYASFYAEDKGKKYPAIIDLKYPLDLTQGMWWKDDLSFEKVYQLIRDLKLEKSYGSIDFTDKEGNRQSTVQGVSVNAHKLSDLAPKKVSDALKRNGFDGVIYEPYHPQGGKYYEAKPKSFIVLDNSSIKEPTPKNISSAYHAAKKDGSNPELVKAVEDLLGTGKEKSLSYPEMVEYLASHPELMEEGKAERRKIGGAKKKVVAVAKEAAVENTPEGIAARIRNKKQKGALSAIDFGISVTVYNGALEFMASQVEKGTKLGNAIANTIKWIDEKVKGEKWNKGAFGRYMNDTYKVTLGDGREVEVIRDDSKETAEVINGWYQPIEQKILDSKEESLPAKTWADRLKSKEDEDLWTGVRAFLEEKGTERVSRQELLDFIKDNRVEIVEVVKGEKSVAESKKRQKEIEDILASRGYSLELDMGGEGYMLIDKDGELADYDETPEDINALQEEYNTIDSDGNFNQYAIGADTKFSQYQLEGEKENYKEVLVTMPIQKAKMPIPKETFAGSGIYKLIFDDGSSLFGTYTKEEVADVLKRRKEDKTGKYVTIEEKFQSSHFNEPNILVHLRMNTRTDAEGNKVLFLEEVQSDWGQKGKKEGFSEKANTFSEKDVKSIKQEGKLWLIDFGQQYDEVGIRVSNFPTESEAIEEALRKINNENDTLRENIGGKFNVPKAPFVTDTNAWTKLGLKYAIREAIAQGADRVAWTTGEQQNERYDLSKQVNSVKATNIEWLNNGYKWDLTVQDRNGDKRSIQVKTDNELADNVGKELAEKIVSENPSKGDTKKYEGLDLKVGGKGMIGFYGSPSQNKEGIVGGIAKSLIKDLTGKEGKIGETKIENSTQNSIEITPELKASVEAGMPLFGTATPEQKLKQAFKEWRNEQGKMGIVPNWERLAEADIKLLKALGDYIATKLKKGAYDFNKFLKDIAASGVENIDADRERWQKFYNDTAEKQTPEAPAAPKAEKKEEGEPEGKKPVRELPEAPEGQVVRAVLGRSFQATTSEKVAKAIEDNGLFRTPGTIEEAFRNGRKLVDELGWDGAYELFQNLSATLGNGIVLPEDSRLGIFQALTEDLQKRIDDPVSSEQQTKDAKLMAEAQAKLSEIASGTGLRFRLLQEIYKRNTVPYQYERRIKQWKSLFPDSPITEELTQKLKEAEAKYNEAHKKFLALYKKQQEWEQSQAVSDIREGIESESKTTKKPPTSILKKMAAKVRKLGISRPGIFSAATPASLAWDAAVEAVAVTLEAGGSIEIAIKKGIAAIADSKWYRGLSDAKKKEAEAAFIGHYADAIEERAGMAELVKGNIVVPHSLIRYYVSEGMNDINEIADAILETLKEKYPDLTQREVKDAITGYARKVKKKTKPEIESEINQIKNIGRLESQLEDLRKGIVKEKSETAKKALSQLEKNLITEIDKAYKELFGHTPRQMSDAERLAAYKERAKQRIAALKEKISTRDFSKKERRPPFDFDQEASDLELEQYLLDEEWAEILREEEDRQGNKFLQAAVGLWNTARVVEVGVDFGVAGIMAGLASFNDAKQTATAFARAWKALVSATNYQKVDAKIKSHPLYLDAKKAGLKFYSPKDPEITKGDMMPIGTLAKAWNLIGESLEFPLRKSIGKEKSKQFYDFWKRLNPIMGLERSSAAFINTISFGLYLRSAQIAAERGYTSYKDNPKLFEDNADVANTLVRKSSLMGLEKNKKIATALSVGFFSAQNWASIIKLASPYTFVWLANKRAGTYKTMQLSPSQQVLLEVVGKAIGSYLATLVLIKMATGWEDDDIDDEERKKRGVTTVNLSNPKRSDWLKVHMPNQIVDPTAGLTQEIILTYRVILDMLGKRGFESTKTGIETYLGEGTTPSALGLAGRQVEGKFNPSTRFLYRFIGSKQIPGQPFYIRKMYGSGEEINMKEEFGDLFTNLTYETAKDQFGEYDALPAAALSLLAFFGYGFTTEERFEEKAISKQIQETLVPERKQMAYERAFKSYAKDGDIERAKKVFQKSLGGQTPYKKAKEILTDLSSDNVSNRYKVKGKYLNELLTAAKTKAPIKIEADMSDDEKREIGQINALPKEALERIKSDYKAQYEELNRTIKVLNSMGIKDLRDESVDWKQRMNKIEWVKKYQETMGVK